MDLTPIEKYMLAFKRSKHRWKKDFDPEYRYVVKGYAKVPKKYTRLKAESMTIGEVAFILRKRSGLTMRDVSSHLQVSKDIISYRENLPKYFGKTWCNLVALSNWMTPEEALWATKKYDLKTQLEGRPGYEPGKN